MLFEKAYSPIFITVSGRISAEYVFPAGKIARLVVSLSKTIPFRDVKFWLSGCTLIDVRLTHPAKAAPFIVLTFLGRVTVVSDVQYSKAPSYIVVTLSERVTDFSALQ